DRVAATKRKAVDCGNEDSREVVGRVIGLSADTEDAWAAERVAAARHVADLGGDSDQLLVAHELGNRGGQFRRDRHPQTVEGVAGGRVVEEEFAELTDGE